MAYKTVVGIYDAENDCIHVLDEKGNLTTYYSEKTIALFDWELPDDIEAEEMSAEEIAEFNEIFGN